MNLLRIESSLHGEAGQSTRLARRFTDAFVAALPDSKLVLRDLLAAPIPHLDAATFAAFAVPADKRDDAQRERVALSDALVVELKAAGVVVLGLPMYNFGVPSSLKAYIDRVMRAGLTFGYGAGGPHGLLENKTLVITCGRGGTYAGTAADMHLPYVRQVFGFMGFVDVHVVLAEGLAQTQKRADSLANADAAVAELALRLAGAVAQTSAGG